MALCACNANITVYDVTTWSWVNLVHPLLTRVYGICIYTILLVTSGLNFPNCPNSDSSLAMVNSFLTAIRGRTSNYEVTNSLFSLTDNKWTKQFSPMPTKHWLTAAVCSGRSLVVAGGLHGRRTQEPECCSSDGH